jgi:predicted RNA-binding protein with PUA-like domain
VEAGADQDLVVSTVKSKPRHWLFKSEPSVFSIQDLAATKTQTTCWEGIRNYQARNTLRDDVRIGDLVLFYHSNAKPPHVAGVAEIVRQAYPDPHALDPTSHYFDPKCSKENPVWVMVDLKLKEIFKVPVPLPALKADQALQAMVLLQKGSRLSIQPVSPAHFATICKMGRKS